MLITRLSRPLILFSKNVRCFSGGHGHEKFGQDYDGVNRRVNRVTRHDWWESGGTVFEETGYRDPTWWPLRRFSEPYYYTVMLSAAIWAWLFYHFYYEGHELYAKHYPNPKTDLLSDEYLGVPPDDEGLAPEKKWVRTIDFPLSHWNLYNYPKSFLVKQCGDEGPYKM